jgi:hypothetical protein
MHIHSAVNDKSLLHNHRWLTGQEQLRSIFNSTDTFIYDKCKVLPQQTSTGPRGFRQVKAPDFLDFRHYVGGSSSALSTGRFYPRRNRWYSFLEAESTPGHMVLSVATERIPSDTTGNRSRDRPTSSAVQFRLVVYVNTKGN